jgi:hypothetical protein
MTDRLRREGRERRVTEKRFCGESGLDDVRLSQGRSVTRLGEQITAEQRTGGFLEKYARFPVVRDVRGINVPNAPVAEIDDLAVGQLPRRSIAQVVERDHTTDRSMRHLGAWRNGEEFVHCPALV